MNSKPETRNFYCNHARDIYKTLFMVGIIIFFSHIFCFKEPSYILNHLIHLHRINNITKTRSKHSNHIVPTNISHIVFGIASSAKSWPTRRGYVKIWWRPNETRGTMWFDYEPVEKPWPDILPPYKISENVSKFNNYDRHGMHSAIRMTRVILETFKQGLPNARWFVMTDDDTVVFIDNLVDVLKRYDHEKYYYIGDISECVWQNAIHSFEMAFGGGGYALSYPLVRDLVKILDGCIKRYPDLYSHDQILQSCLAELGVSLTRFPGFHQFDLRGDISGYLSTHPHAPLISFHHLDSLNPIFPAMSRQEALQHLMKVVRIDHSRVLQQTVCYDLNLSLSFSISWGYSVQIYESLQPPAFLQTPIQTFRPWTKGATPPFMFNVRPVTDDSCLTPHILFFDRVDQVDFGFGHIITSYVRRTMREPAAACDQSGSAQSVTKVLVSSPTQSFKWDEGRRECCKVVEKKENIIKIEITACMDGQAVEWTTVS